MVKGNKKPFVSKNVLKLMGVFVVEESSVGDFVDKTKLKEMLQHFEGDALVVGIDDVFEQ